MARNRSSARRRQRSVRVTVAVSLLAVATVAVLAALPTQSPALLSVAAVSALVLGWASVRIVWTEVLQSRRENATDRAATASAYKSLFSQRASEHAEFTTAMTERLAESHQSLHEYQAAMVQAQRQTALTLVRAEAAEAAHAAAMVRVDELERSIEMLRAEGIVEELVAFDEKIAEASGKHAEKKTAKTA
jgi:hypothetical protein